MRKNCSFFHPSGGGMWTRRTFGVPMATIYGVLKLCEILGIFLQPEHLLFLSQESTGKWSIHLLGLYIEQCKCARTPSGNKATTTSKLPTLDSPRDRHMTQKRSGAHLLSTWLTSALSLATSPYTHTPFYWTPGEGGGNRLWARDV